MTMHTNISASTFHDAIRKAGYEPPPVIERGRFLRFPTNGKSGDRAGWCKLFPDGDGGIFGDWRTGQQHVWYSKPASKLDVFDRASRKRQIEEAKIEADAKIERIRSTARDRAAKIWAEASAATERHGYLQKKGVKPHGSRLHGNQLVLALRDVAGTLHSLQFITEDGRKSFLTDGRKRECYFAIGKPNGTLCVAEGFATGATIHEDTGCAVAVAFDAGNLEPVARALRNKYPAPTIIICADDDAAREGNPGLTKATAAAQAVNGLVAIPDFGEDRPEGATDFNDLHRHRGPESVKAAIAQASAPEWSEPLPLTATMEAAEYPADALPNSICAAVQEVAGFVKAPIALVAASALAAISTVIQAFVDVVRADRLIGPVAVFLLTIADSGERKSTCDSFFSCAIRTYDQEQLILTKGDRDRYAGEIAAWTAERDGILMALKQAVKTGKKVNDKSADMLRENLITLEQRKPKPPRVPKLMRGDDTPENLAWVLSSEWPVAGVITAEAGIVLGAHAMGRDSLMRNLALLNILWDGGLLTVGRRTSASFEVRGARLTMGLQVQEATMRSFFDRSGPLPRGSGILARFLMSWPKSTQGSRPFSEPPEAWPCLTRFNSRISEILKTSVPIDEEGALSPRILSLSPDAKSAWVAFHDAIEGELGVGGDLSDVRDVASKTADNAARLGALFHVFEHGIDGAVCVDCFENGSRVAAWHLNESRRFFGELAVPAHLANAAKLNDWLTEYCRHHHTNTVARREVQRYGPGVVRDGTILDAALEELIETSRVRIKDTKPKGIHVNPALIEGATP